MCCGSSSSSISRCLPLNKLVPLVIERKVVQVRGLMLWVDGDGEMLLALWAFVEIHTCLQVSRTDLGTGYLEKAYPFKGWGGMFGTHLQHQPPHSSQRYIYTNDGFFPNPSHAIRRREGHKSRQLSSTTTKNITSMIRSVWQNEMKMGHASYDTHGGKQGQFIVLMCLHISHGVSGTCQRSPSRGTPECPV